MKFSLSSIALAASLLLAGGVSSAEGLPKQELPGAAMIDASPTATFTYNEYNVNFTFTFTANRNGDLWFSMAAPSKFSWMAVGSGDGMDGALMFVAYGDGTPAGVTLSGRFGTGHVEPVHSDKINLTTVIPPTGPANTNRNGMLYVSARCTNCTKLAMNHIDLTNTAQPFLFALGEPGRYPATKAMDGPLRRHCHYGQFTMDLTMATDDGGDDPISLHDMNENSKFLEFSKDTDIPDLVHALALVLAFLVVFPLGALSMGILKSVKIHMIFQTLGLVLGVIGAASGFYLSTIYNRSKHFGSGHQIIGLLLVVLLIGQWIGGLIHHRHFVKSGMAWMNGLPIKGHRMVMGPLILILGLINGATGFRLAVANQFNKIYVPIAIVVMIAVALAIFMRRFIGERFSLGKKKLIISAPQPQPFGRGFPEGLSNANYATAMKRDDLPSYSLDPVKPRSMV